ncbi:hypothetical protein KO02_17555 [Sphingobacterium sp. ML3W]|uniref:hypothetical protein n=1 Tax=Sphingobacterium sp. ML3W TaxID=1538644 RepID=UPI0004F84FE5|nr:hypothetical protein [Sphingobacterium sp. ML3W]AIM38289.1 hypothetical protein KO02_17555 [Sphingobacterium sp. ML3W]
MTKEELIKQAYGEVWDILPVEQQTCALKYNGWTSVREFRIGYDESGKILNNTLYRISRRKDSNLECDQFTYRPKSLKGLENNNGWNCINDCPIPNDVSNDNLVLYFSDGSTRKFNEEYSIFEYVTHWRIVEDLPKPMFNDQFTELLLSEG